MINVDLKDASESTKVTAENMTTTYLNAKTRARRFYAFMKALQWAITASSNCESYRQEIQNLRNKGKSL